MVIVVILSRNTTVSEPVANVEDPVTSALSMPMSSTSEPVAPYHAPRPAHTALYTHIMTGQPALLMLLALSVFFMPCVFESMPPPYRRVHVIDHVLPICSSLTTLQHHSVKKGRQATD